MYIRLGFVLLQCKKALLR